MAAARDGRQLTRVDAARWQRVKAVLDGALDVAPEARASYVSGACDGDRSLEGEVVSLLEVEDDEEFLERPAFVPAAEILLGRRTDRDPLPDGARVGPFRIVRELGRGGMGTVYLAERDDGEIRGIVALKVISRGMDTELVVRRFRQERQILAELSHPNVARLLTGGTTDDGRPYFVMEYVDGQPIDQYCEQQWLTMRERLELFRSVCAAVQYAHQHLVVHRDIKPANVLVTPDGVPKLLDFGIAKVLADGATRAGATVATMHAMTPAYASPEQLAGAPVTTLTDVYSLGVLLYLLVTGRHPHPDGRPDATREPERPSGRAPEHARTLVGDIDNIVLMALRAEPARRYASVALLSEDVRRHLVGLPVIARPDTLRYRVAKFTRRNVAGVIAAGVVALTLVAGFVGVAWQGQRARTQQALAERRFAEVRQLATTFLFELDERIAGLPGATDARELLVRRALQALDVLARDTHNDHSLLRDLAAAYVRVGDVQGAPYVANLGHTAAALTTYRKALALLAQLAAERPADVETLRLLAHAYSAASAVQARAGDVDGAIATQRRSVAVAEALVAAAPRDATNRTLLAESELYLGRAVFQKTSVASTREALTAYERARDIRRALATDGPGDAALQRSAAVSGAYVAYPLWRLGEMTGDTTAFRGALQRLAEFHTVAVADAAEHPSDVKRRRDAADGLHEMADLHLALGETAAALHALREARPVMATLAAADPRNAEAQRDLAAVDVILAVAHAQAGDARRAIGAAARARTVLQRLVASDGTSSDDLENLARATRTMGDAERTRGDAHAALARYAEAAGFAHQWAAMTPSSAGPHRALALTATASAELRLARGERSAACAARAEARAEWRRAATDGPLAHADSVEATRDARAGAPAC